MYDKASLKCIFELHSNIEKIYFKEFERSLEFAKDLNHTHIKTIMILNFEGESPMSTISNKLNLEKGSFTPVANHLINLGYIEKKSDIKDKRVYNLALLEKGRRFAKEVSESHITYVGKLLERLTESEKNLYFSGIEMINNLTKKLY